MRTLGIYVQVPFCQTKCTYCNFHTGVVASSRFAPYVEAVCREILEHRELLKAAGVDWPGRLGRSDAAALQGGGETPSEDFGVDTVYIGGGTPSLLDPAHLQNILDAIREAFGNDAGKDRFGRRKSGGEPPHSKTTPLPTESRQVPSETNGVEFDEVTLEADPETIEAGKAAAWARAGINRVSFGLQSFADKALIAE